MEVVPAGYRVSSPLRDETHDGDCPGLSWALVASTTELKEESPGFMKTIELTALRSSSGSGSCGTSTSRTGDRDAASTSRAASSSTLVYFDDGGNDWDGLAWSRFRVGTPSWSALFKFHSNLVNYNEV